MAKRRFCSPICLIISLALLTRIAIFFFQYSGDVKNHFVWGNGFLSWPFGFYSQHFPGYNDPNYPPFTIVLFALCNLLLSSLTSAVQYLNLHFRIFPSNLVPLFMSENMRYAFLKLPAIFSDIGIGLLLYKLSKLRREKNIYLAAIFYLFNPAVIYISSVWGQIESLTLYFLLLSIYFVLYKKDKHHSLLFFTLAALTKQTALWFAPFYLLLWIRKLSVREWIKAIIWSTFCFCGLYLMVGLNPFMGIANYFSTLAGSSNVVSDAAWNIWFFLFPQNTPDTVHLGIFSVRFISISVLIAALVFLITDLIRKYNEGKLFAYLFFWSLLVFFIQTRVHDRHLAPALVFCLITPGVTSRYFLDYLLLSAYHMSNLMWSLRLPFI